MLRTALLCLFLGIGLVPVSKADTGLRQEFRIYQDSLRQLGEDMYRKQAESERLAANFAFIKTLVRVLKLPHSFDFDFDSLDMISIRPSPDREFRIFSWPIRLSDGSYLYYGTIQLRTRDGTLKLFPLLDKTYQISDPEEAITRADQWYGAQYFDIIPHAGSYILLGWKGHNPQVTQQVIDVLTIDRENDTAWFGKTIFDAPGFEKYARIIFRFAAGLSMHLTYQPDANRIIYDHLVPSDPQHKGKFEHYGPDLTFDAWILDSKKLRLVENADYQ